MSSAISAVSTAVGTKPFLMIAGSDSSSDRTVTAIIISVSI